MIATKQANCAAYPVAYDYSAMPEMLPGGPPKPYAEQGKRLREAREALRIDQAEMARRVDVEPTTYWRYEVGERSPKPRRMERIAAILQKPPEFFTRGVEPPQTITRGEAMAMIEDELELTEAQKARLRHLLQKFRHHRLDVDYIEAAADLVRFPDITDESVHATAVTIATHAQASETDAKKLTRHSKDETPRQAAAPPRKR
jgi:transcriptional regulator with XRE-family HTH domain